MLKENNMKCHPEALAEGSMDFSHLFRMTQCETGRSMIEMLGVLAIIGVLSVGGIAGYTTAMNKHRANELLNEASKRAVVVVPQIMAGQTPSITEFTNNDLGYGVFQPTIYGEDGTTAWVSTDKKFTLSITGVSEAVCNQMKNTAGATIKGFSPETCASGSANNVKLTFNNDMSAGSSSKNTEPTVETDKTDLASCTADNSGFDGWRDYTGDYTNQVLSSGDRCVCHEDYPIWNGTACVRFSETKCNSTHPCNPGEYCRYNLDQIANYNSSNAYPFIAGSEQDGTCEKIASVKKTTGGEFYYSGIYMDWFSAKSWCEALGKNMVKLSTLSASPYKCDEDERTCNDGDFTPFTDIGLEECYWTDTYSGRYAFFIDPFSESFDGGPRHDPGIDGDCEGYALCE